MLYATTRSKVETYTAQRALKEERSPDGGLYLPAQIPVFTRDEIAGLLRQPSGAIMAEIINRFFGTRLSQLDVEFSMGKRFFGLTRINHRITISELWRNAEDGIEGLADRITAMASAEMGVFETGLWTRIVARIALLFASFGELTRDGSLSDGERMDVAVLCGTFEGPFAVWMAGQMGLPLGTIIVCCNENSAIWDLFNRGQMKLSDKTVSTDTPKCDIAVPHALELLIRSKLEWDDVEEFVSAWKRGGTYFLNPEEHRHFREGFYVSVVGSKRMKSAIPNLYRTNGYVLDPYGALVHAGLMDFRSRPGQRRAALLLSEYSPLASEQTILKALALSSAELRDALSNF